jgi:hypothetical protein
MKSYVPSKVSHHGREHIPLPAKKNAYEMVTIPNLL